MMIHKIQPENGSIITVPPRPLLDRRSFGAMGLAWAVPFLWHRQLAAQEPPEEIGEALEGIRKRDKLPGLIAGHFTLAGEEELGAVGFRRAGSEDALRVEDRMHLGSCTKSMTATIIGMLVDEGELGFETTLGEIFNDDPQVASSAWKDTTIRQLMCHTSGAIANPPWGQFDGPVENALAIRREILHWLVERPRRDVSIGKFHYSNLGYTILGFGPPSKQDSEAPWGHEMLFGFSVANDTDNPPALGPAGTVHASMSDWIRYLRVHLMIDPAKECGLPLTAATLAQLHQPYEGSEYAGGWICGERDWAGGPILTHNGSNTHWYCVVFLAPQQGRGVIAASNAGIPAVGPCDQALQWLLSHHPHTP
jgi:CubicO group peptidase (beta-lactamase class C family)